MEAFVLDGNPRTSRLIPGWTAVEPVKQDHNRLNRLPFALQHRGEPTSHCKTETSRWRRRCDPITGSVGISNSFTPSMTAHLACRLRKLRGHRPRLQQKPCRMPGGSPSLL